MPGGGGGDRRPVAGAAGPMPDERPRSAATEPNCARVSTRRAAVITVAQSRGGAGWALRQARPPGSLALQPPPMRTAPFVPIDVCGASCAVRFPGARLTLHCAALLLPFCPPLASRRQEAAVVCQPAISMGLVRAQWRLYPYCTSKQSQCVYGRGFQG